MRPADIVLARRERPLLARIDLSSRATLETRLIYPSDVPQTAGEKIKHFLLMPVRMLTARNHVKDFLSRDGIRDLDAAKKLLANIGSNPFCSVSEDEFSTVLAEAALKKVPFSGTLRGLTRAHFEDPDHCESAIRTLMIPIDKRHQHALAALMNFIRNPSAPLERDGLHKIEKLLLELDERDPPPDLSDVLIEHLKRYQTAHEVAVRINKFAEADAANAASAALNDLRKRLSSESACIAAFEKFLSPTGAADSDRHLLARFLTVGYDKFPKLNGDTQDFLLPKLIAVEDSLAGKQHLEKFSLPADMDGRERDLAEDLLSRVRGDSSYSPAAALALMEYLVIRHHIKTLDIKGSELASLKARLINPESRIRLVYVVRHRDLLLQSLSSLGKKIRLTADAVLKELTADLAAYAKAEEVRLRALSPPDPASQSPDPAASSRSAQS